MLGLRIGLRLAGVRIWHPRHPCHHNGRLARWLNRQAHGRYHCLLAAGGLRGLPTYSARVRFWGGFCVLGILLLVKRKLLLNCFLLDDGGSMSAAFNLFLRDVDTF